MAAAAGTRVRSGIRRHRVRLQVSRDFGQGLIASRRARRAGTARTPLALAIRINRGPWSPWSVAFVGLGVIFGYFIRTVRDLFSVNPALAEIFAKGRDVAGRTARRVFATIPHTLIGIVAAIAGVQIVNRVRTEELEDRAEPCWPRRSVGAATLRRACCSPRRTGAVHP